MYPPKELEAAEKDYDPLHTMLALNMATVSINRILATQDRIVLDQEYENIMNKLSLGNIRSDSDILELYRKIMDIISQKRLRTEEAEFLQARYNAETKSTLSDTLSLAANAGLNIVSGNFLGLVGEIATAGQSIYFSYQDNNDMREGMNQDLWKLRTADIADMNEIQKQLLTSSWNLLNQYKLPENERLVDNVIKEFYQAVSSKESPRRLRMLQALENDFKAYPPYWFYRAKAARESENFEEGKKCLDKFDEVWRPVLRQDPFMLEACKYRVHDLLMSEKPVSEIHDEAVKYLDIAKQHTPRKDWADNLFIGTVYFALGEKEKGISCVRINEDFGHEKQISSAIIRQMEADKLNPVELSNEIKTILSEDKENENIIPVALIEKVSEDVETEVEKLSGIETLKKSFMSLYASEWSSLELSEKLSKTVDATFEADTKELKWGTRGFQLARNRNNIAEKIQEDIFAKLKPEYESFIRNFQDKYYTVLQADTSRLLRQMGARDFIFRVNPMVQARVESGTVEQNREKSLLEGLWEKLKSKFSNVWLASAWLIGGVILFLFRGGLAAMISPVLHYEVVHSGSPGSKATGATVGAGVGAAIGSFIPIIGTAIGAGIGAAAGGLFSDGATSEWREERSDSSGYSNVRRVLWIVSLALMAWGGYEFYHLGMQTQSITKEFLHETNQNLFTSELPNMYWSAIEPYIKEAVPTSLD